MWNREEVIKDIRQGLKKDFPKYEFSVRGYKKDNKTIEIIINKVDFKIFKVGSIVGKGDKLVFASNGTDGYRSYNTDNSLISLSDVTWHVLNKIENWLINLHDVQYKMFHIFIQSSAIRKDTEEKVERKIPTVVKPVEPYKSRKKILTFESGIIERILKSIR